MVSNDKDINLLVDALFLSQDVLRHDPRELPSQLLGRLHDIIEKDVPLAPQDPRLYPYTRYVKETIYIVSFLAGKLQGRKFQMDFMWSPRFYIAGFHHPLETE